MSLKKLLGLESFPIREVEIMQQIKDAYQRKQEVIEFISGKKKVKLKLSQIATEGVMRDYQDYYSS